MEEVCKILNTDERPFYNMTTTSQVITNTEDVDIDKEVIRTPSSTKKSVSKRTPLPLVSLFYLPVKFSFLLYIFLKANMS